MKISDIQVTALHPERWGDDLDVVNAARVSFEKEGEWEFDYLLDRYNLSTKDAKLVHYLAKHQHHSPFNHSFLKFRIKAPIFVARQLVKHKFMPWNEVSRRYVDSDPEFFFPEEWRGRAENVKQGSSDKDIKLSWGFGGERGLDPHTMVVKCLETYQELLDQGVAPEQARMVLPQNMMTEWYWSGTLGAFLDMLRLRLDPHTQKESRDVAQLIAAYVKEAFPVSYHAVLEN